MNERNLRRKQVLKLAAEHAYVLPRLDSGYWFHQDMRDNLYYAMHLYAASMDSELELTFDREDGLRLGEEMLLAVLRLQVKDRSDPMYGHWPLSLNPVPNQAPAHTLPVELLGPLLAWYAHRYGDRMGHVLRTELEESLRHIYQGNYYRQKLESFSHHDSKYISQQLIWGELFQDRELAAEGRRNLKVLLDTISRNGMREYGALPWFWHWVQAFSCANALVRDEEARTHLKELLNGLWAVRTSVYLRGAWAGPHSRVLPHDMPADRNHLIDYVQFGDFDLGEDIPRLEAAGLLEMEANEEIIRRGTNRVGVSVVKRRIPKNPVHVEEGSLHAYVYVTPSFAAGGVWEYAEEYLNEQHRWDITLPASTDGRANKLYFFHPGNGYHAGDLRHSSSYSQVILEENIVGALYCIPEDTDGDRIIGCLPLGEWSFRERVAVGLAGGVYLIVHLLQDYETREADGRINVSSAGKHNGVIVEAIDEQTAKARGWRSLAAVVKAVDEGKAELFHLSEEGDLSLNYKGLISGKRLELTVSADCRIVERKINGADVTFEDYTVFP